MALFDRETDTTLENEGKVFDFGDFRVQLRRSGGANLRLNLEVDRVMKPYRAASAAGIELDEMKARQLMAEAFINACVVRWETRLASMRRPPEGITAGPDGFVEGVDLRGKLVPMSVETLLPCLTGGMHGLLLELRALSDSEANYRLEQREGDAGN